MSNSPLLGIGLGLAAASSWGCGDFCGGIATRRAHVYGVVVSSQLVGLGLLAVFALVLAEPVPAPIEFLWAGVAGLAGAVGLVALYRGLATGPMGVVAPVAAIVSAILPLIVGWLLEGIPALPQLLGFVLAICAVWLITRAGAGARLQARNLALPLVAGLGFGVFLILIDQVSGAAVFWPLTAARGVSVLALLIAVILARRPAMPNVAQLLLVALVGLLDTGGNAFYALATRTGRLDTAAVLGSLYPAMTVVLARLILKEQISRLQGLGLALAALAIVFIAS